MPAEPETAFGKAPAPSLTRWLIPAAIFAGLAAAAFALVLFFLAPMLPAPGATPARRPNSPEKFGRLIALDPVVVNLAQSEGRRYLKAAVQLEVADEEKAVKELEARKPQLLDILVTTLSRKSLVDVTAPDALDLLRRELAERVGQAVGEGRLRRVFITEFVVQ